MRVINIEHSVPAAPPVVSERVLAIASMFGVGVDEAQSITLVPPTDIPLPPGGVVFVTGPSGSGKSTVLRALEEAALVRQAPVLRIADLGGVPRVPLVDALGVDASDASSRLARAGLGDAFVMLRTPDQLSDGQRCRFDLARLIERADATEDAALVIIDEFGATLDRITARAVARAVRIWVESTPHTCVVATAHDDLLEPLAPDVLVYKGPGDAIEVVAR